ncbi:MAG: DNA polymerase III subunit [Muribaculaceae bacterium]|nr:DNA polymerase III subunit [Muribaculaceae bacterium]
MRFADIIGNKEAVSSLRAMADSGKIPHALLLSGPTGIGKMQLARAFVSYLNCENRRNGDSCGVCPACRRIDAGNNPDVHYVYPIYKTSSPKRTISMDYAEQWQRMLKESPYMDPSRWLTLLDAGNSQPAIYVDEADEIAVQAAMSSYSDRYKIFLIWLPERLRPEAANKLLKILEEPFDDTVFICVSNEPGLILPTIYSRLRRIEMRRPSRSVIMDSLLRLGVSQATAENAATVSEGSLLKAFDALSSRGEQEEFSPIFMQTMRQAFGRRIAGMKALSDTLAGMGREKSIRLLDYFAHMTRENFIANLCVPTLNVMTADEAAFSGRFAPFINADNVEMILKETDAARTDISRNANSKLVWFDYMLRLMLLLRPRSSA